MRRHYLITYDIADDRRRNKVFEALSDNGNHEQFSVFVCQLSREELESLKGVLQSTVHQTEDQVLIIDLGKVARDLTLDIQAIGKCYAPPVRTMIV